MELEDSDDLAQEFLGGKLQLNADEIKSPNANLENKLIDTADNINNNDKNRWENSLISPIVSLPQRSKSIIRFNELVIKYRYVLISRSILYSVLFGMSIHTGFIICPSFLNFGNKI